MAKIKLSTGHTITAPDGLTKEEYDDIVDDAYARISGSRETSPLDLSELAAEDRLPISPESSIGSQDQSVLETPKEPIDVKSELQKLIAQQGQMEPNLGLEPIVRGLHDYNPAGLLHKLFGTEQQSSKALDSLFNQTPPYEGRLATIARGFNKTLETPIRALHDYNPASLALKSVGRDLPSSNLLDEFFSKSSEPTSYQKENPLSGEMLSTAGEYGPDILAMMASMGITGPAQLVKMLGSRGITLAPKVLERLSRMISWGVGTTATGAVSGRPAEEQLMDVALGAGGEAIGPALKGGYSGVKTVGKKVADPVMDVLKQVYDKTDYGHRRNLAQWLKPKETVVDDLVNTRALYANEKKEALTKQ